jgi:hypothetical protein
MLYHIVVDEKFVAKKCPTPASAAFFDAIK